MFDYLNDNKMTVQARAEGKTYSPFVLVLIYFAVMIIVNVVTNVVMTPVLTLLLTDSSNFKPFLTSLSQADYSSAMETFYKLLSELPEWKMCIRDRLIPENNLKTEDNKYFFITADVTDVYKRQAKDLIAYAEEQGVNLIFDNDVQSFYSGSSQVKKFKHTAYSLAATPVKMCIRDSDRSDPKVTPYSVSKTTLNTFGGANWNTSLGRVNYTINVEESGYYELSFRYRQSFQRGATIYRRLYICLLYTSRCV